MIKVKETIDTTQLKQAKSLGEFLGYIPEIYFERIILGLLCIFCLSPVMMVALLNSGVTSFNPYYLLLQVGYVGLVFSILIFWKRKAKKTGKETFRQWILKNKSYLCLGGVLLCGTLATVFSADINGSFFGDYYRKEGLLTMGAYAGIFSMAVCLHREKLRKFLIQTFVFSAFLLGLIVLLQWLGLPIKSVVYQLGINDKKDFIPWAGIFHNINHYGYYLSIAVMAAAGLLMAENRKIYVAADILAFGLLTWVLAANNTFGAYLGVCVGLLLLLGVSIYRKEGIKKILLVLALFIVISLIVNGIMGQVKNNFVVLSGDVKNIAAAANETVANADQADDITKKEAIALANHAGSGRWQLWMGAIEIIKEYPLFGTGPDNLADAYARQGIQMDRPHNEFLQIGASLGVPAMILYLCALGFGYIGIGRRLKTVSPTVMIACGAITGYLVSALFGNTMYYTYPYFLIFLALAFTNDPGEVSHAPNQRLSVCSHKQGTTTI